MTGFLRRFQVWQSPHLGIEIHAEMSRGRARGKLPLSNTWAWLAQWVMAVLDESRLSVAWHVRLPWYPWPAMLWWENWELWVPLIKGRNQSLRPILHSVILSFPLAPGFCANQISLPLCFAAFLNGPLAYLQVKWLQHHQNSPERTIMEMKPSGDVVISRFHFSQWATLNHKTSSTLINYKVFLCFTKLFIGSFKAGLLSSRETWELYHL